MQPVRQAGDFGFAGFFFLVAGVCEKRSRAPPSKRQKHRENASAREMLRARAEEEGSFDCAPTNFVAAPLRMTGVDKLKFKPAPLRSKGATPSSDW